MKKTIILLAITAATLVSCKKQTKCLNCFVMNNTNIILVCGTKEERQQKINGYGMNGVALSCHEQK